MQSAVSSTDSVFQTLLLRSFDSKERTHSSDGRVV